ncbi:MAG: beta-lactamase family protein [Saprospiraceae bacterium]|nr:beta-lactamase family protein [Saprospiraceae bacterium]
MKIFLYILLGLIAVIGLFFVWFFLFYFKIPELNIPSGSRDDKKSEILHTWFEKLREEKKWNGGVLWAKNGKPLLLKTYGFANPESNINLTESTLFPLASLSKQFTAFGILVLHEKDSLDIDDEVAKHIKGFTYKGVTIRHLLNQTSGIPDIYMELAESLENKIPFLNNQHVVDLLIKENRKADHAPGETFVYSNTNYVLLAYIIETVSNQSFEDFMKNQVFTPLEMRHSRVWNLASKDKTFEDKAEDFEKLSSAPKILKPTFLDGVSGDGSVYCSLKDFLIWDQVWYKNPLITYKNLKLAMTSSTLSDGTKSDYGFGWVTTPEGCWHNGAWLGARTYIKRDTIEKTCLVLLDNSSNMFMEKIVDEIKKTDL